MEIKYLKNLQNNPLHWPDRFPNEPIDMEELQELEKAFNKGNPFPAALRELLFLAGNYCWIFNMGINESQMELQQNFRKELIRYKHEMPRPFYVLDTRDETFSFIYLDEDDQMNNPILYNGTLFGNKNSTIPLIESTEMKLSEVVDHRIHWKRKLYPQ